VRSSPTSAAPIANPTARATGGGKALPGCVRVDRGPGSRLVIGVGVEAGEHGVEVCGRSGAVVVGVFAHDGPRTCAGLRTARRAADRYAKLLATGLTSLILCQGLLNIFVVLGLAPLTGVPLPFISYAPTNLIVMLSAIGLLLGIARPGARRLRMVDPARSTRAPAREPAADRDRRRRDRRARRAGAGGS